MKVYKVLEIDYETKDEKNDKLVHGISSPEKIILYFSRDPEVFSIYKRVPWLYYIWGRMYDLE